VPEGSKENTNAEAFGLPTDRFEAAVEALVELRDTGRLLIFLTRRGSVKLVGDIEDFRQEYIARAKDNSIDQEQSKKAQDEIRQLTSVIIRIPNPDSILDYLERVYREDFPPTEDPALREEFRRRQAPKIDIVSRRIVTDAMRQRARRLATAVGACVEELDCEVVSEREDSYRGRTVNDPFLRLRLRYSEGSKRDLPYFGYFLVSFEVPEANVAPGFEFECDLADIDLLIKRLNDAKRRLLRLQEPKGEAP